MKRAALLCVTLLLLFGMTACASGPAESGSAWGRRKALPLNRDRPGRSQPKRASGKHRRRAIPRFSPSRANRPRRQRSRIRRAPSEQGLTLSVDGATLEVSWRTMKRSGS